MFEVAITSIPRCRQVGIHAIRPSPNAGLHFLELGGSFKPCSLRNLQNRLRVGHAERGSSELTARLHRAIRLCESHNTH